MRLPPYRVPLVTAYVMGYGLVGVGEPVREMVPDLEGVPVGEALPAAGVAEAEDAGEPSTAEYCTSTSPSVKEPELLATPMYLRTPNA